MCFLPWINIFIIIIVPRLDRVRGAVVSGKNLCLSVTQFLMACNLETVEEIDTKLVLPRLQHQQMCSALRIFLQGQGQLVGSFNYLFPVCHSNIFWQILVQIYMHVLDIWGMCREHSLVTLHEVQGHFF